MSFEASLAFIALCIFIAGALVGYMVTVYTNEGKLYYRDMPDGRLKCHISMSIEPDEAVDRAYITLKVVEDRKGVVIKDETETED